MAYSLRSLAASFSLVALVGCSTGEIGSEIDTSGFGNSTMQNTMAMTGQYVQQLGLRFANEVNSTVNFAFNSAELDAEAQAILRQQANWIRQFPELRFRVYGHTDLVGSNRYNHQLGLRRAQAVVNFFATQGISRNRLEAMVSHGKTRPVIPTPNPERENRRTVTEVSDFVKRHPTVLNGKYAEVIFREYVRSAVPPHTTESTPTGGMAGN